MERDASARRTPAELLPLVYEELRRLAGAYMRRERGGHTLQSTALVHEAYLRLAKHRGAWNGKTHFFALAAVSIGRTFGETWDFLTGQRESYADLTAAEPNIVPEFQTLLPVTAVNFFSSRTVSFQRPLARRRRRMSRPPLLDMRLRKPCSRRRGMRFG